MKPVNKSPTQKVVLGLMGVALLVLIWSAMSWQWALGVSIILLYEGWTLINKYEGDTISEILWTLSVRPIVPWMFGVATGWAITSGLLENPWVLGGLLFLQGHFWFQQHRQEKTLRVRNGGTHA